LRKQENGAREEQRAERDNPKGSVHSSYGLGGQRFLTEERSKLTFHAQHCKVHAAERPAGGRNFYASGSLASLSILP
jgi:hypothetical protein